MGGLMGKHANMMADFAAVITVTPKIEEGAVLEVWATEAGAYGLPGKVSVKMSPETTTDQVWGALQQFAEEQCGTWMCGLDGAKMSTVTWTPTIKTLSFEGTNIHRRGRLMVWIRDSKCQNVKYFPVSQYLKDGEAFQAHGELRQDASH